MSKYLLLEIGASARELKRTGFVSEAGVWLADVPVGDVAERAVEADKTIVVCEGAAFSSWVVDVPVLGAAKLQKILPNLMADLCATPIMDTHFSLIGQPESGKAFIIAAARSFLDNVLEFTNSIGVSPDRVLPDYCLLPVQAEHAVAVTPEGNVVVRMADGSGFCGEPDLAVLMVPDLILPAALTEQVWKTFLAKALETEANILTGPYAKHTNVFAFIPLFKRSAILAMICFFTWAAGTFYMAQSYNDKAEVLYEAAEEKFKKAFPDVKRIVNLEAQMRSKIKDAEEKQGGQFLSVSSAFFKVLSGVEGASLDGVRYDQSRTEYTLTLAFSSFAEADTFRQKMNASGIAFSEGSSRQEGPVILTDISLNLNAGASR
ncbi:type II secretion system protein GspL [Kordiimonas pumila]|uniref:Type II secretion system protein GspL n=1 Tax=Kordiimonas pumila TaxID=2161677 RepID=A0ABV7D724_9PROT|nr:type II secretion system protein GspL [Kordiimonas pumila]